MKPPSPDLRAIVAQHPPGVEVIWRVEIWPENVKSIFAHPRRS
jgi:hypothetical protein